MDNNEPSRRGNPLIAGFKSSWRTLLLIAAINTGYAGVLWSDDPRPFWHPFVTCQLYGFAIAYCINVAAPWDRRHPILRVALASAIGTLIGVILVILVKRYSVEYVTREAHVFLWNFVTGTFNGFLVGLIFVFQFRETRAITALHKAEADRHLLSKQAIEAELKLLQAQVEPHFLFNTLASVQYLTETNPKQAGELLGHLIGYLRAALPQLRAGSTTLGKEAKLAEAYLNVIRTRVGARLDFSLDIPPALAEHPFPPNLLLSLVENAIKHGIEPAAAGGRVEVSARSEHDALVVRVADTGQGLADCAAQGLGLRNVRERLAALYGEHARLSLEANTPRGARATIVLPIGANA
jgi:sensor histidine kinase YesM